jgi:hypothetical protein
MQNKLIFSSLSLLLVGLFTTNNNFTNANALLTAPTNVDYAFRNNASFGSWGLYANPTTYGTPDAPAYFTRTVDGSYYNYSNTFQLDTSPGNSLIVTNTFNRSNTGWVSTSSGYIPYLTNQIGSNGTVGTIASKYNLQFNNQTPNNYFLSLDVSSSLSGTTHYHTLSYNGIFYPTFSNIIRSAPASLINFYIPSFTNTIIDMASTSNAIYFDAWYLENLGTSSSYQEGYDNGYDDGLEGYNESNQGLFDLMSSLFGAIGSIFSIYILPGITIGMLVFVPLIFTLLIFIIKILRGGS